MFFIKTPNRSNLLILKIEYTLSHVTLTDINNMNTVHLSLGCNLKVANYISLFDRINIDRSDINYR